MQLLQHDLSMVVLFQLILQIDLSNSIAFFLSKQNNHLTTVVLLMQTFEINENQTSKKQQRDKETYFYIEYKRN